MRFAVILYPCPVQVYVPQGKYHECDSQVKMYVAPIVSSQRQERFNVIAALAVVNESSSSAGAGREDVPHDKPGASQRQENDQAYTICIKVYCRLFHLITMFR